MKTCTYLPIVRHSMLGLLAASTLLSAEEPKTAAKTEPTAEIKKKNTDETSATPDKVAAKPKGPSVEIVFVLDTTSSMSDLIEGAKEKIWAIANDIVSAKPKPQVRFGLIGFRDRGDDYVIRSTPLTDDLDHIHAQLKEFKAEGGGDAPESVSEALHAAVTQMPWSQEGDVLKVIYLVGDAPPQNYKDGKDWKKVSSTASSSGIHINTIQCGNMAGTAEVWKAIASRAEGAYAIIPQDGNMVAISAPQDEELARLNIEIGATLIPCGSSTLRLEVSKKQAAAEKYSAADNASRLGYNSKSGKTVQGEGELIDALNSGSMKLKDVKTNDLPEELRKLSPEELEAHVEKQKAKRAEIQARIAELVKQRDTFIQAERQKQIASGKTDSFDEQVAQTLRKQAAPKGIVWEK